MVKKILNLLKNLFKKKETEVPSFYLMNNDTYLKLNGALSNSATKVYIDNNYKSNEILAGYKAKQTLNTGYIYSPYTPVVSTPSIFTPPYYEVDGKKDFELT